MNLSKLRELVTDRETWHAQYMGSQRVGHHWATELNWCIKQRVGTCGINQDFSLVLCDDPDELDGVGEVEERLKREELYAYI